MGLEEKLGETALDLVKNENVQNKVADLFGMLFPYAGIKKKAVDMYIEEIENSDLSTAKSTGCGKVEISTRVFNRVWKTVLIIYICRKLPLWKRQWETFGKGCKAFFEKERSNFLFLRRL